MLIKNPGLLLVACIIHSLNALDYKVDRNISYHSQEILSREGEYAKNRCLLDIRYPVGVTNFATVINFHGGGITKGRRSFPAWPNESKDIDPVAFVAAGYRLLTNATPHQAIGDAAAAVAWTLKNISRYGGDPNKVFVTGISAGGYLTAMVGLDYKWLKTHGFKPTDLCGIIPLTGQMTKHFNVRKIGFNDSDPQFMPKVDEWAPLYYASTNPLPPSCFLTGGRDIEWKARVEENALLAASLVACGHNNCEFHETEGNHGGGVYPSRYYLRDFVMKTCDAGGVARFADSERIAIEDDAFNCGSYLPAYLQMLWSMRFPGSDVIVMPLAELDYKKSADSAVDRILLLDSNADMRNKYADVKKIQSLTSKPVGMNEVRYDFKQIEKRADGISSRAKGLLYSLTLLDLMSPSPMISRVAIDAEKGYVYRLSDSMHRDAAKNKLPDSFNVKISNVQVRNDGIAFTYAPKSMPLPVTEEYRQIAHLFPVKERFNQEIFIIEKLPEGKYDLSFDGVSAGVFSAEEFNCGVNVSELQTPNQIKAQSFAKFAENLSVMYSDLKTKMSKSILVEQDDLRQILNSVRPQVSRVVIKRIK